MGGGCGTMGRDGMGRVAASGSACEEGVDLATHQYGNLADELSLAIPQPPDVGENVTRDEIPHVCTQCLVSGSK